MFARSPTFSSDVCGVEDKCHLLGFVVRAAHLQGTEMEEKIDGKHGYTQHRLHLQGKYEPLLDL